MAIHMINNNNNDDDYYMIKLHRLLRRNCPSFIMTNISLQMKYDHGQYERISQE